MADIDILFKAIIAGPDDDLTFLAYADALEERGEPNDDYYAKRIRESVRERAEKVKAVTSRP